MSKKRFKMSKGRSKKEFRRKAMRVARKNLLSPMRGGIRA